MLITCHGRIMPCLAELLLLYCVVKIFLKSQEKHSPNMGTLKQRSAENFMRGISNDSCTLFF